MPKLGILSCNTFFPKNGDILDDLDDGISWVCERAHTWLDEKTGARVRYALLVGRHASLGDRPIPKVVDDTKMPVPFLSSVTKVHRTIDEKTRHYTRNDNGNYVED